MEFNITDRKVFLIANSAICTALFLVTVVPTLLLDVMCVLALIAENTVSKKIKALLINIFAAEICHWLRDIIFSTEVHLSRFEYFVQCSSQHVYS